MLLEFHVKNFRSFRDEALFSFIATADNTLAETNCIETDNPGAPRLVRSALVYGANASGKSNLMFAFGIMRTIVEQSTKWPENAFREQYTPFRLDSTSTKQPTEFEVSVLLDGTRYQYGFKYDADRIQEEWLLVYKTSKAQQWFSRKYDSSTDSEQWEPFSSYFTGQRETWKKATRSQALFLTTAVQLNSEQLKPFFDWLITGVIQLPAGATPINPLSLSRLQDPAYKQRILSLLNAADIHVCDIRLDKRHTKQIEWKVDQGRVLNPVITDAELPVVEFCHRVDSAVAWFDERFESAGTQKLFAFAGQFLDAIEKGTLLVIDEFDTSFHPLLARYLIELIQNPRLSTKGAQLWMTTHDTSLLDPMVLRRDQVWFVEKDKTQSTKLYPLTDFSPRKNEALERGYLMGRYGALPFLSEFRY